MGNHKYRFFRGMFLQSVEKFDDPIIEFSHAFAARVLEVKSPGKPRLDQIRVNLANFLKS